MPAGAPLQFSDVTDGAVHLSEMADTDPESVMRPRQRPVPDAISPSIVDEPLKVVSAPTPTRTPSSCPPQFTHGGS